MEEGSGIPEEFPGIPSVAWLLPGAVWSRWSDLAASFGPSAAWRSVKVTLGVCKEAEKKTPPSRWAARGKLIFSEGLHGGGRFAPLDGF